MKNLRLVRGRLRSTISIQSHRPLCRILPPLQTPILYRRQFSSSPTQHNKFMTNLPPDMPPELADQLNKMIRRGNIVALYLKWLVFAAMGYGVYSYLGSSKTKTGTHIFDPPRFTPFTIVKREEISPTSIILTLRPRNLPAGQGSDADPYKDLWEKGTWSVEFKQPDLQIARSYTPLPPTEQDAKHDLRFLIRKEHKGEVSGYLHTLSEGVEVQLRGPHPEFDLPQEVTDVVFLAGGTGIAPAIQVAHTLLERRPTGPTIPRIHIVWANRRRADCEGGKSAGAAKPGKLYSTRKNGSIVRELERLRQDHPSQLSVDYLVDEEGTFLDQKRISQLTAARTQVNSGPVTTRIDSKLLFVSGPEGFVSYIAGPKKWEGGKESQGELGGILFRMGLRTWKIWKL